MDMVQKYVLNTFHKPILIKKNPHNTKLIKRIPKAFLQETFRNSQTYHKNIVILFLELV